MIRRTFLLAGALILAPLILPLSVPDAHATVAAALSLDVLVGASTFVVVATPGEQYSVWEDLPSGRRIVTYTKLSIEHAVVGVPGTEMWVRTLGGVVDKIGQSVPGEAHLTSGARSMLFLAQAGPVMAVTAMAQGHYPVLTDNRGTARLSASPDPGMLIPRRGPAVTAREVLVGGTLDEAIRLVQKARRSRDEKK